MNFPSDVCFTQQNIILIGILLPGSPELKHDINTYIELLVKQLLNLWSGVSMKVYFVSGVSTEHVRYTLLCSM